MTTELDSLQGNPQEPEIYTSSGILKPIITYGQAQVEATLVNPDFRTLYSVSTDVERKYAIALTLITDGRIEDPTFLLDGLVPSQSTLSHASISDERDRKSVV